MADDNKKTILVKQKDGSFKRIPLSDLKKQKKDVRDESLELRSDESVNNQEKKADTVQKIDNSKVKKKEKQNKHDDIFYSQVPETRKKITQNLSKPIIREKDRVLLGESHNSNQNQRNTIKKETVQKDRFEVANSYLTEEEKPKISAEDYKSPLEEKLDFNNTSSSKTKKNSHKELVEEILSKISFTVENDLKNRLRSAVELYLRDIRGIEQTRDLLLRSKEKGGLSLEKKQTDEILGLLKQRHSNLFLRQEDEDDDLPVLSSTDKISKATPFNSFEHANLKQRDDNITPVKVKKEVEEPKTGKRILNNKTIPTKKIKMSDISSPEFAYGPVDDIKNFDLQDLRRLSSNYDESVSRLKQKFLNIKEESIVLFLQAMQAWRLSPLYLIYLNKLVESINKNKKLELVLAEDKNGINLSEVNLLVKMEEELNL